MDIDFTPIAYWIVMGGFFTLIMWARARAIRKARS